MKFGIFGGALATDGQSSDSQSYADFVDYVCEAETLGFESVFVVEHHFTGLGQISATLSFLAYLAARTSRIRLGTAVTVLPWHNPVLLAEQIATLDVLSGGRADIGVGKGYRNYEFEGFNMPPAEAAQRFEETLEFVLNAWKAPDRFSHEGPFWKFNNIVVEPAPVQRPHPPVWVGANSINSIERTAKRGLNLLLAQGAPPADIEERIEIYRRASLSAGRAFDPKNIGVARSIVLTHSEAEREAAFESRVNFILESQALKSTSTNIGGSLGSVERMQANEDDHPAIARQMVEEFAIIGSADEIIAKLHDLKARGVEYVLLCDTEPTKKTLRDFAREVMSEFRPKEEDESVQMHVAS